MKSRAQRKRRLRAKRRARKRREKAYNRKWERLAECFNAFADTLDGISQRFERSRVLWEARKLGLVCYDPDEHAPSRRDVDTRRTDEPEPANPDGSITFTI